MLKKIIFYIYSNTTIADQHQHQTNLNFAKNNNVLTVYQNKAKGIYCNLTSRIFCLRFLADRKLQGRFIDHAVLSGCVVETIILVL